MQKLYCYLFCSIWFVMVNLFPNFQAKRYAIFCKSLVLQTCSIFITSQSIMDHIRAR